MSLTDYWDREPERTDIRWAVNRGYELYGVAFFILVVGALSTGVETPPSITPLLVGLSATMGWIGAMLQIHAVVWAQRVR